MSEGARVAMSRDVQFFKGRKHQKFAGESNVYASVAVVQNDHSDCCDDAVLESL